MIRIASFAVSLSLILFSPALAATAAVRAACTSDAERLCGPVIHDAAKRHACMHAHAAQLSKRCVAAIRGSR